MDCKNTLDLVPENHLCFSIGYLITARPKLAHVGYTIMNGFCGNLEVENSGKYENSRFGVGFVDT